MSNYGTVHRITMGDEDLSYFYEYPDDPIDEWKHFNRELLDNEYFVIHNRFGDLVGIFKKKNGKFQCISRQAQSELFKGVGARKGNYEQMCVIDAILDDSIDMVVVTGNAGTGKSYITLMAGLFLAENSNKRMLYTREIIQAGKCMGYLPGDSDEKTDPFWRPAKIAISKIQSSRGKYQSKSTSMDDMPQSIKYDKLVEFVPLQFLRGTSIDNRLMFNDEAQNQDLDTVQMFSTRAGEGSKVVLAGSTKQCDDKSLRNGKDGMTAIVNVMKGEKNFACINLLRQERNNLAQQIDVRVEMFKMGQLK